MRAGGGLALETAPLVEDQPADPVTPVHGRPGQEGRGLGRDDGFESDTGTEAHGGPLVDQQPEGPFPLLAEELDVGPPGAGRDPPVHVPRIVARLIDPRLVEFHAPTAKARQVPTAARGQDLASRRQIQPACLAAQGQ